MKKVSVSKSLNALKGIYKTDIEVSIIKAVEAEVRAGKKHLPLIKKAIAAFINTGNEDEINNISKLYLELYKIVKISLTSSMRAILIG